MLGRPSKQGMVYMPLDVDLLKDPKIEDLRERFQEKGVLFYVCLLSCIWKEGHWVTIDDRKKRDFCRDYGYEREYFDIALPFCINVDLFNKDLFQKYNILTSASLQERYLKAAAAAKRTLIIFIQDYTLIDFQHFKLSLESVQLKNIGGEILPTPMLKAFKPKVVKNKPEKRTPAPATGEIPFGEKKGHSHQEIKEFISIPYGERNDLYKNQISEATHNSYVAINELIDAEYFNLRTSNFQMSVYEWRKLFDETKFSKEELLGVLSEVSGAGINSEASVAQRLKTYIGYARAKKQKTVIVNNGPKPTEKVLHDDRDNQVTTT